MELNVVFIGTGAFGEKTLLSLITDPEIKISAVITGQDKLAGRGLKPQSSPVKEVALMNKLIVHQPKKIQGLEQKIIQLKPDYLLVVAYGEIIKKNILSIPKIAAINIHGSLLPKYRGASPIHESLLNGDKTTGITWIVMNETMDSGDIIGQTEISITETDNYQILSEKLAEIAAKDTPKILKEFAKTRNQKKQDSSHISYCRKIKREDGAIDVHREDALTALRKIKAYTPWPGCYIFWNNKRLKIIQAEEVEQKISSGLIQVQNNNKNLLIGTKKNALSLLRVQPESKRVMNIEEFLRGLKSVPTSI